MSAEEDSRPSIYSILEEHIELLPPFVQACRNGDIEAVHAMLADDNVDVNALATDILGNVFDIFSKESISAWLEGHGRAAEITNEMNRRHDLYRYQRTGFIAACYLGHLPIVELLVSHPQLHHSQLNHGLIAASAGGQAKVVASLLTRTVDVNFVNDEFATPLVAASSNGHATIVELLLEHGEIDILTTPLIAACSSAYCTNVVALLLAHPRIDVNKASHGYQNTALHMAALLGLDDTVLLLLDTPGIEINAKNNVGCTPLILACGRSDFRLHGHDPSVIVARLLSIPELDVNAASLKGQTAIMEACQHGWASAVQLLLDHPNIDLHLKDENGETALFKACARGQLDSLVALLGHHDINVNATDADGRTALLVACETKTQAQVPLVANLLKHPQIDVNHKDNDGMTCLMSLCQSGADAMIAYVHELYNARKHADDKDAFEEFKRSYVEIVVELIKLLVDHPSIDVNATLDDSGATAFYFACHFDHLNILQVLFGHSRLDPHQPNDDGTTPFMVACAHNRSASVALLMEEIDIDVNNANKEGHTAMVMACATGAVDVVQLLITECPQLNVNYQTPECRNTALLIAVRENHLKIVESLLEHPEIDISLENKEGLTAMDLAIQKEQNDIIELLMLNM
ncbi:hypothetical protein AeNC1_011261 [Aphanomyces euteiches]|nr:hypothetical protein AeNC1_011261 [Aphanomyces euteiches]